MNTPPNSYITVPHTDLQALVAQMGQTVGLPVDKANLLAELLTANDLRGVFSHGTTQMATYARLLRDGILNNQPDVHIAKETPVSVLVDGDGGLGYFASHLATQILIEKAKSQGIAIALTRNHGHFGAAGLYSRMTLPHDLLCFVTSGHQLHLEPGQPIFNAAGGSPMSFSAPAGEEESLVLDFGAMHDLYPNSPHRDEIARLTPGSVFRAIGTGAICQSWGGFLAGVPLDPTRAQRSWEGANQGSLIMAFQIDLFFDAAQFKREMDEYVRAVKKLQPLEGFDECFLPGGVEAVRARTFREQGVPVGPQHQQRLEEVAQELGLLVPWQG
ncbi:MAG TPA: Ldh family oxidoreductase [Caldilineaceae bacterium]|nr:Ldh family oxidoreductase [Caldilineaceae bacterium]